MRSFLTNLKVELVGICGAALLTVLNMTIRWRYLHLAADPDFWHKDAPKTVIFWHGRQLMMPFLYNYKRRLLKRRPPIYALISHHNDGRMVARAVRYLRVGSVAGSSSRGGREATLELLQRLKEGCHVAITPDGPRGPARILKMGAVKIAQVSGRPVYPIAFCTDRHWTFGSWDGMLLPKPFCKGVFAIGDPLYVSEDADHDLMEQHRLTLEERLNNLTAEVDRECQGAAIVRHIG